MHQQENITRGVAFERADHGDATHGGPVEGETVNGGHDVGWSTQDDGVTTEESDEGLSTDDDWVSSGSDAEVSTDSEEEALMMHVVKCQQKRRRIATAILMIGMHPCDKYMSKATYRIPKETGYQWTMRTLGNRTQCYNMFRMHENVFDSLHNILVQRYGLKSTKNEIYRGSSYVFVDVWCPTVDETS